VSLVSRLFEPSRTLTASSSAFPPFNDEPSLEAVRLSGHDGVNGLFDYESILKTSNELALHPCEVADFDLGAFIGHEVSCAIQLDGCGEFIPGSAAYPAYEREWHDYDYSESRSKGMSGGFK